MTTPLDSDLTRRRQAVRALAAFTVLFFVGAALLQSWNLPEEIVEAVANHHLPTMEPRPKLSVVTHVGNCLAHLVGSAPAWDSFALRVDNRVTVTLDLNSEKLELMIMEVRESFDRVDQFMGMV